MTAEPERAQGGSDTTAEPVRAQGGSGTRAEPVPPVGAFTVGNEDGYSGAARLTIGESAFDVQVELRGHFEPIDGRYHWYGRVARNDPLAERLGSAKAFGVLQTVQGSAPCEVAEPDTWNRYRITGYSTPPFRLSRRT